VIRSFDIGQWVRLVSVDDMDILNRYPDIEKHKGETGTVRDIIESQAGLFYGNEKVSDKEYKIELHGSKQPVILPPEALEPFSVT